MAKKDWWKIISLVLVLIGSVSWGLAGLFQFGAYLWNRFVYFLVVVSGIYWIFMFKKATRRK